MSLEPASPESASPGPASLDSWQSRQAELNRHHRRVGLVRILSGALVWLVGATLLWFFVFSPSRGEEAARDASPADSKAEGDAGKGEASEANDPSDNVSDDVDEAVDIPLWVDGFQRMEPDRAP